MNTDRDIDQTRAGCGGTSGQQQLADLLAGATAPARPEELAREQDVMVAFRQARLADSPAPRRRSMVKLALAKLLTVKVAAGVAAATVAGGAALAATGNMPGPLGDLGSAELRPAPAESAGDRAHQAGDAAGDASPSPSLSGLCEAYLAEVAEAPGRALDSPAFQVLISEAGSEDDVHGFCADLVPDRPGARPSGDPQPADVPRVEPGGAPTDLPTVHPSVPVSPGPPGDVPGPPPGDATDR